MIIIALLTAAFLTGAVIGALALVVLAIHRENRDGLPARAPTRITAAARNLMGLQVSGTNPAAHAGLRPRPVITRTDDDLTTATQTNRPQRVAPR